MGTADIELSNFLNDTAIKREYFKYFSGKELTQILSWGLSVILGLSEGPAETSNIAKMTDYKKVLSPVPL